MDFTEAKNWWYRERWEYLDSLDLWWSNKYIGKRRYKNTLWDEYDCKKYETLAQILIPNRSLLWIKGWRSELEVFKWAFKWNKQTEDEFISLIRDHEGKHAHLWYSFPEFFNKIPFYTSVRHLKIRDLVEEIICDEFQLSQIERYDMKIRNKKLKSLEKDIKSWRKKLQTKYLSSDLSKLSQTIIDILNGDHRHSNEIRFGL